MGYIPPDAQWYLADVVLAIRVGDDPRQVVHVNLHLVRADSPSEAYEKALAIGREGELCYLNPAGQEVRTDFLGLRQLSVIHDALEDGAELAYALHSDLSRDEAEALTRERSDLSVFRPIERASGPDYSCGEVLADVRQRVQQMRDAMHLTTPRLALEPLVAGHADELFAGLSDPGLYTFMPVDPPASLEALRRRYERLEVRWSPDGLERWLNWAVRLPDGPYVGLMEATVRKDQRASVAYFVCAPFMRRGYGAEATAAVIRYLVDELQVRGVEARIDTRNVASQRLVERVGLRRVRLEYDADSFKGSSSDEYVYEWPMEAQGAATTARGR
ncbi:MAG: GNAT family N-acetyltransferase [Deltaproteobacteria bacterium]|nr:GNAT family N-acetyltransferase [Myxococcales bacterium]MDP3214457.1 GNAT family N-acetyltransferase [Deltaproteobacteria bacterium]